MQEMINYKDAIIKEKTTIDYKKNISVTIYYQTAIFLYALTTTNLIKFNIGIALINTIFNAILLFGLLCLYDKYRIKRVI